MNMTWIRTHGPFGWIARIPWYDEWSKRFKAVGGIMVDHAVEGGWQYVRIMRRDDESCIGLSRHTDANEAFREAGQKALDWFYAGSKLRRANNLSGLARKKRLYDLLNADARQRPEWLDTVREATADEEGRGFSLFVRTDVGEIGLKVISSVARLIEFEADPRYEGIPCVVVNETRTDVRIQRFAFIILQRHREKLLAEYRADDPSESSVEVTTPPT